MAIRNSSGAVAAREKKRNELIFDRRNLYIGRRFVNPFVFIFIFFWGYIKEIRKGRSICRTLAREKIGSFLYQRR